jgi:glycosyltransferase involved in cell wall biosynthesis
MRLGLVITSHERADALAAVLASVAAQRIAPAEIVIADDGSGATTQAVLAHFLAHSRTPARVVSQAHEGFRVARLRNLGIAAASTDYLVFIDGDMLLHRDFIADHLRQARPGFYTQGVRVHADEGLTRKLIADPAALPSMTSAGLGGLRRLYLVRSRTLASVSRLLANGVVALKACNFGAWRDDIARVNGFDEAFEGWGPEDKDLCVRLENAGVRRQTLLFGGIAIHLHHAPASRTALPANLARLADARRQHRTRCERGLDTHFGGYTTDAQNLRPAGNIAPP